MSKLAQIKKLHDIFMANKFPCTPEMLAQRLDCSKKTIGRYIEEINRIHDGVLIRDEQSKGWYYDKKSVFKLGLIGPWFSDAELMSLSMLLHIVSNISEGFLKEELKQVEDNLEHIFKRRLLNTRQVSGRIKILPIAQRVYKPNYFSKISEQLFSQQKLYIEYCDFSGHETQREISPQHLVYYRDNWYLDAWCHLRSDLRTFSLSRMTYLKVLDQSARKISGNDLKAHYEHTYGIFSGTADKIACLCFDPSISKEIFTQVWHPDEVKVWDNDCLVLSIPYSKEQELVQDILKYGDLVTVLEPDTLKTSILNKLHATLDLYGE